VSWGPLVEYSAKQSKIKKVASRLGQLFSHSSSAETPLPEIIDDLRKELLRVRRIVHREQNLMKHTGASKRSREKAKSDQLALLSKRKRLMYLFVRDLSSGICGEVLANKAQRDALSHLESLTTRVSAIAQVIGWLFVFFMNMGMLIYVYLFAMTQTQSRQSAWFQSFVMWIIFEIFVSSTGLVVFFHLLVPLYVFTEVSKIKEKVLLDLISFREKYLRRFTTKESGAGAGGEDLTQQALEFNAAKYLFASWRVASLFPELPESQLVLQFSTPWPKKKFGDDASEVSREYDQAVILTSLSRVLLFFIASLFRYHMLVQDIIVQLVCNSGFALLILLLIRAARIQPLLPVAFVLALFLAVFLLLRFTMSRGNKEMLDTLKGNRQSVQPSPSTFPTRSSARGQRLSAHPDPAVASTPLHLLVPPPPRPPSNQVMAIAMPKSHLQQSHQSVPLLGHQEGGDEDHDEEVKPFEDSSKSSLPRPHHPHVVLPVETKPSSHEKERQERQIVWEEDEDEVDLGFARGDEDEDEDAEDEDGRQIEWEKEDEEDDQLESVFAEDEKSRWVECLVLPPLVRAVFRTVKSLRRIGCSWWLQLWVSSGLRDRRRMSSLWSEVRVAKVTQLLKNKARQGQESHEQRRSCGMGCLSVMPRRVLSRRIRCHVR
jgi:hypothetical protein